MSIYENGFDSTKSQKRNNSGTPAQKVDISKILNDKKLTELIKLAIPTFKSGAKELLHDVDGNIIGFLTRSNTPYFFDAKELKLFLTYIK